MGYRRTYRQTATPSVRLQHVDDTLHHGVAGNQVERRDNSQIGIILEDGCSVVMPRGFGAACSLRGSGVADKPVEIQVKRDSGTADAFSRDGVAYDLSVANVPGATRALSSAWRPSVRVLASRMSELWWWPLRTKF